jgi:site-specific DNA-methyltransferase (adenine-specific)
MTWEVRQGDCLELLRAMPDGSVDAVVTDPPYGQSYIGSPGVVGAYRGTNLRKLVTIKNDDKEFDPSPFLRWPCAFTGARWFYWNLPKGGSLHSWDKRGEYKPMTFADADIVWVSKELGTRTFRCLWRGICRHTENKDRFEHPTQKPVAVMKWMLDLLGVPVGATVLDPYCGSGSTGVACIETGRNFIGFEIDAGYCEIARKRIAAAERDHSEQLVSA